MLQRNARYALVIAVASMAAGPVGTASVDAAAARGAASTFELTLDAQDTVRSEHDLFEVTRGGTFSSRAPFCTTGAFVQVAPLHPTSAGDRMTWQFTCDDGTGDVTVSIPRGWYSSAPLWNTDWRILDARGIYAGLRGRGSLQGERLGAAHTDPWTLTESWRTTFGGFVDRDAVAPTLELRSLTTKLRRPAGAYSIKMAVTLRDDVEENPVRYTLRASAGGLELVRRAGTSTTEGIVMTLGVRPPHGARTVRLQVTAEDPVGNGVSVSRAVRLPR
jgi:hypothetical protein